MYLFITAKCFRHIYDVCIIIFKYFLGKKRPPLRPRNHPKNREIQQAGSRSSSYDTGAKYSAKSQTSRYSHEQRAPTPEYYYKENRKSAQYVRSSTTPTTVDVNQFIDSPQRNEIYIYNTESPSKILLLYAYKVFCIMQ